MDTKDIVRAAGGPTRVAEVFGISVAAVSQWDQVPAERVLEVARLSGLRPMDIRADLYPFPDLTVGERAA